MYNENNELPYGIIQEVNMDLNGIWKLYYYEHGTVNIEHPSQLKNANIESVNAMVPGNVQLDLSRAGILPSDLFKGENIKAAEKYETYDWWYETEFVPEEPKDGESVILHFGAVDCVAEYYLNGEFVNASDNMYIEQEFNVGEMLKYGEKNTLHVYIKSPVAVLSEIKSEVCTNYYSWHNNEILSVYLRKAPHSFGWDIMPRAITSGIWREVRLDYRPEFRFDYLYFVTASATEQSAYVKMYYEATVPLKYTLNKMKIKISGKCGDSEFVHEDTAIGRTHIIAFNIKNPKLWWPKNYGDPNLYDVTVTLTGDDGEVICSETQRLGFRTVKLDRTDTVTRNGGKFRFIVNGVPVMAVGSNWVPMDAFHCRDRERYGKAIEMAADIGCNILRCWGGNVYEDTEFFELCDENGIMVWQDFAMACHFYPQTEEFYEKLRLEAESVVKKLRNHASLIVWSGDNEIDQEVAGFGSKPSINKITREILPEVLKNHDPARPYIPSSPFISDEAFEMGLDVCTEDHLWGPREYFKARYYSDSKACFVSETGYHGSPSVESIKKMVDEEFVMPTPDNRQWILHSSDQKGNNGRVVLMMNQIEQMFGFKPQNIEDFVTASQISQAEGKKYFIERVRTKMDRMGGVIWWNLVDGWPQMSDAVVDYYYCKKKAYGFIKRSSRPFAIMMDERDTGGYPIVAANGTRRPYSGHFTVTDAETGKVLCDRDFTAAANCNTIFGKINLPYSAKGMLIIKWQTEEGTFFNSYLYGTPGYDFEKYKQWLNIFETAEQNG